MTEKTYFFRIKVDFESLCPKKTEVMMHLKCAVEKQVESVVKTHEAS